MKLLILLTAFACLEVSASGFGQTVSLSFSKAPLEKVFKEIKKQTGYSFVFTRDQLKNAPSVTVEVTNMALTDALNICFQNQSLLYVIDDRYIIIQTKPSDPSSRVQSTTADIRGKIVNQSDEPVPGLSVQVKGTDRLTITDAAGEFLLRQTSVDGVLIISGAEMQTLEVKINGRDFISIKVNARIGELDQVVMMAYGQTTKRLNTGNIAKVTSDDISKQPVSNPIAALEGRVPGLLITQANGYANSPFNIQLRGQNSIAQGTQPFFIIDGVPFAAQNNPINQVTNASIAGVNPFYTINPLDIESIEILKDADATAIYGSRGANGVVLITTKKGKAGKTKFAVNSYNGWSKVTRTMDMMNTQQYVQMRKEAYLNDGIVPTGTNATDILLWDTTRFTDMKKLLIGNTAASYEADISISGGNDNTRFLVSGSLHRETTVLPTDLADTRGSMHTSLNHNSANNKFSINLSANYSYTKNVLPGVEPTAYISRPPNMKLYDSLGNLNWQEGGVSFSTVFSGYANPLSSLKAKYTGNFNNLYGNLLLGYKVLPYLNLQFNLGYNFLFGDEIRMNPSAAIDPFTGEQPSSFFATSSNKTWIAEPQLEYVRKTAIGKVALLIGGTWQNKSGNSISVNALNYQNDLLLNSISGAGSVSTRNSFDQYRYMALFARANYNWKDKYLINFSYRRDGSSRFGPENRFSNFGALGSAWIFSQEKFVSKNLSWISFGKLRASYGTTGNDAIGDYQFFDTWTSSVATYQGVPVILPTALFNPDLAWETNKKFEAGIDLGFLKQRLLISAAYYQNRSGNQLVYYNLPIQTGFPTINKNQQAKVQNTGFEFSVTSHNVNRKELRWTTNLTLTLARNKLLDFPGLATSSYATTLIVGEPLSVKKLYKYLGVDPASGLYQLWDVNGSGTFNTLDRIIVKNTQPSFFGGFQNTITIHRFEFDVFLQVIKQAGFNYLNTLAGKIPGSRYTNQPLMAFNRWQKPGDNAEVQKFTTITTPAITNLSSSDAIYSDASFIRVKTISISYNLPWHFINKIKLDNAQVYLHMQNLFTLTNYVGADPENQNMFRMPPLKTIAVGVQINF